MKMDYAQINAKTIDRWGEEGWEWGQPISHEEYEAAASGGGQQMPVFAALGAECTIRKLIHNIPAFEATRSIKRLES